jgi:hypothetical protein
MDDVTTAVFRIFAEAQHLGRSRRPRLRAQDGWIHFRRKVDTQSLRALPPAPPRPKPPELFVYELSDRERAQGIARPLVASFAPLPTEVVRRCACGGYWERRAGVARLLHVPKRGRDCR